MELREWLIILGLALVSLIVVDGVRRLQRQRRVPRLDQAVKDLPEAKLAELDDEAKEAEINWELPNGGARVVKSADYSGLGAKPKLERQEHPGPSRVLSEFSRSFTNSTSKLKAKAAAASSQASPQQAPTARTAEPSDAPTVKQAKREPHMTMADPTSSEVPAAERQQVGTPQPEAAPQPEAHQAATHEAATSQATTSQATTSQATTPQASDTETTVADSASMPLSATATDEAPSVTASQEAKADPDEPVLRADPEDAAFAKHASDSPKRRQLRSNTAGEHDDLDDDDIDEYRLVDFEGIGRSLKRRLIERRRKSASKKVEKAKRAEALAKQKAERKALEAEQRREAKQAADAEKARIAQEQAEARETAAEQREAAQYSNPGFAQPHLDNAERERYDADGQADYSADEDGYRHAAAAQSNVVRAHPTLEKALRHDVCGEHAKETLSHAEEMVVISVLSRDPEGFDGGKLLELMMACGLRYSSTMGVFNRFETESAESGLQFSMVNVLKPGTFPIQEMDEFVTPGITLLMPLPGAVDSSAAFEAMVETAMVVVRHMGGELKDENRSVMTAQTIEFARQRVHDFERRHRLHRHMQAR